MSSKKKSRHRHGLSKDAADKARKRAVDAASEALRAKGEGGISKSQRKALRRAGKLKT